MMKQSVPLAAFALVIIGFLFWFSVQQPSDKEKVGRATIRLQLQWYPQAQFAGFYVAEANNFYADEGLAVTFSHGGPEINPIQKLVSGQADIATVTGDQTLVWESSNGGKGVSLRAIGTVFNRNIAVFMARTEFGPLTPQTLIGKKVGVFPSYDTENVLLSMLQKHGISSNQVDIVSFPNIQAWLAKNPDTVEVFPSYRINEPLLAEQSNIRVNLLDPEEFRYNSYH